MPVLRGVHGVCADPLESGTSLWTGPGEAQPIDG